VYHLATLCKRLNGRACKAILQLLTPLNDFAGSKMEYSARTQKHKVKKLTESNIFKAGEYVYLKGKRCFSYIHTYITYTYIQMYCFKGSEAVIKKS
jgi:hypothetical protein